MFTPTQPIEPNYDRNALMEIDRMRVPILNVRSTSNLALTPFQLFAIAFNLYMLAAPLCRWIDTRSPTMATLQCFGGFCLWLSGFFDWYNGRTVLSTIDFLLGLLNFTWYLIPDLTKYENIPMYPESNMKGGFLAILLGIWIFIIIATKDRGCLYLISFFVLGVGLAFHMIFEFSTDVWAAKAAGYCYLIAAILIWITGIGKGINDIFGSELVPIILPNL